MKITVEYLKEKSACAEGVAWFVAHFPKGGEYQAVLDALAADAKPDYAQWLLNAVGPTSAVLEVESWSGDWLFFAGTIKAAKGLSAVYGIKAGSGIKAGWGIKAGLQIFCKKELSAEFRIFAGIAIWKKEVTDDERSVICGKLVKGAISFGLLKEEKLFQE